MDPTIMKTVCTETDSRSITGEKFMGFRFALYPTAVIIAIGAALWLAHRTETPSDFTAASADYASELRRTSVKGADTQRRRPTEGYRSTNPSLQAQLQRGLLLTMIKGLRAAKNGKGLGGPQQTPSAVAEELPLEALRARGEEEYGSTEQISPSKLDDRQSFENLWSSESTDREWTVETQTALSDIIDDAEIGAALEHVECGTTICRAEILFDDIKAAQKLKDFAGDPVVDVRSYVDVNDDETLHVVLYMSRPGQMLEEIVAG